VALCVKGVDYSTKDISQALIEWLILARIQLYSKVYLYIYAANVNIWKTIR